MATIFFHKQILLKTFHFHFLHHYNMHSRSINFNLIEKFKCYNSFSFKPKFKHQFFVVKSATASTSGDWNSTQAEIGWMKKLEIISEVEEHPPFADRQEYFAWHSNCVHGRPSIGLLKNLKNHIWEAVESFHFAHFFLSLMGGRGRWWRLISITPSCVYYERLIYWFRLQPVKFLLCYQ